MKEKELIYRVYIDGLIYQVYIDGFNDGLKFFLERSKELRELISMSSSDLSLKPSNSSNLSKVEPRFNQDKAMPNNQKVTLEQIKQIKILSQKGLTNKEIARTLEIKPSLILYWRKHTPKNLIME